jgi:hypothetical protein
MPVSSSFGREAARINLMHLPPRQPLMPAVRGLGGNFIDSEGEDPTMKF